MRQERIPLYDLEDRLLGWSTHTVFGYNELMLVEDYDKFSRMPGGRVSPAHEQFIASIKAAVDDFHDRRILHVDTWPEPIHKETHVWYFKPCPLDHLETM